nr:tombus P33-like protein [Tolivirales sp.]
MVSAAFTAMCDMGPSILMLVVVVELVLRVRRWWTRPTAGAQLVRELDAGPDAGPQVVSTWYQRDLAYRFKAEYGELRYNNANLCIASDFCRKVMKQEDVRYTDMARILPLAMQLCLLPTDQAAIASQLAKTHEVMARRAAVDCPK